jgi:ectoine hydroxylase-related dioxygenase (phytanoyl-CoA dioxygenase family)
MAGVIQRIQVLRKGAPKALTAAQIEQFDRDGVLLPIRGVSEEVAIGARAKIESLEKVENLSANSLCLNGHLLYKWQHELATTPRVLDMVEDLVGPNFFIWKCQLWIKEQDSDSFVGWHQDANYWGLDPPDCVNVWMALTDVTPEHGPMQLLRGSHVEPLLEHEDLYEPNNLLTRGQVIPALENYPGPDSARTVSAVLSPGEMSIHHLCTAHGGGPMLVTTAGLVST